MFRNIFRFAAPLILLGFVAGIAVSPATAGAPNSNMPIFPFAKKAGFNTLTRALQAADLVGTINRTGPITVFAPTDEAFEKLEMAQPGTLAFLLANPDELRKILLLHVVEGEVPSSVAIGLIGQTAKSVNGLDLTFSAGGPLGLKVNNASVTGVDNYAKNGVIHVVDEVILPQN
jgi:uncharacterized surface protein with fasciclin (FAS1) repeats